MFKQRVLTALILIPLVILAVLMLPNKWFFVLTALFIGLAALEWTALIGMEQVYQRLFFLVICFGSGLLAELVWPNAIVWVALIWWTLALALIYCYPKCLTWWHNFLSYRALIGVLILSPSWVALTKLHRLPHGPGLVLILLCLVWSVDSGGYFAGRRFGRRKLLAKISPGKTWAGFFGGILCLLLTGVFAAFCLHLPIARWLSFLSFILLVGLVSVLGDLTESLFKRLQNVKDSGQLLPGHGGILDRLDSLFAAAPVFFLGVVHLGFV